MQKFCQDGGKCFCQTSFPSKITIQPTLPPALTLLVTASHRNRHPPPPPPPYSSLNQQLITFLSNLIIGPPSHSNNLMKLQAKTVEHNDIFHDMSSLADQLLSIIGSVTIRIPFKEWKLRERFFQQYGLQQNNGSQSGSFTCWRPNRYVIHCKPVVTHCF